MTGGRDPRADAATTYVALLRGINVGGRSPVDMGTLRATFERIGFGSVRTYINSGNVVFNAPAGDDASALSIEAAIAEDLGLQVPVLVRRADELGVIVDAVPAAWVNDSSMKCDVYFLWPDVDRPSVVDGVPHNPAIDELRYVPGAFVRRIDRQHVTQSPMTKIVGTPLYRRVTVRNINTVRKLHALAASSS